VLEMRNPQTDIAIVVKIATGHYTSTWYRRPSALLFGIQSRGIAIC